MTSTNKDGDQPGLSGAAGSLPFGRRLATPEERAENIKALEELQTIFPTLPDEEVGHFLVAATAYPFASVPNCMEYARHLAEKSGGDWRTAITISCEECDAAMDEANAADVGRAGNGGKQQSQP